MRFKKAGLVAFMAFLMTTQSVRAYGNEEVVISCTGPTFYEFNGYVVELPEGRVKALSGRNCSEENLVIDNRVKVIGWRAFDGNVSFKSVTMPNTVTLIEARAFSNTRFSSINIPISLVEIGDEAFASSYFGWRTKVVLPDSVKRIGDKAFWGSHLESISIPDDLVFLGKDAFVGSKLSSVEYCGNLTGFNINNDRPLVIIEPTCSSERKAQFQARAKAKAEAEAKAKAEAEAKAKAEAEAKAKAEAEAKAKAKASSQKSITCIKGKSSLKVLGKNPKCPKGYKRK